MELILKYFPNLSEEQKDKLKLHLKIFPEINESVNLISRKDIQNLECNHMLHSMALAKVYPIGQAKKILDVGCGGGFPGIPLAIMHPNIQFTLVDSILKKIKACRELVSKLDLKNVEVIHGRAEKISGRFDFVVSRAVAPASKLLQWNRNNIYTKKGNGFLFLKGGDLKEELDETKRNYRIIHLRDTFEEEFFETKKLVVIETN